MADGFAAAATATSASVLLVLVVVKSFAESQSAPHARGIDGCRPARDGGSMDLVVTVIAIGVIVVLAVQAWTLWR